MQARNASSTTVVISTILATNLLTPWSLQYAGFGHFFDIFRGCQDAPGLEKVSPARLILAVDNITSQRRCHLSTPMNKPEEAAA